MLADRLEREIYLPAELALNDHQEKLRVEGPRGAESAAFQCVADTRHEIAFTSAYTATQGQAVWCGMIHESGTIDGSNFATVRYKAGRAADQQYPKISYSSNSGSSWSISYSYYVTYRPILNPLFMIKSSQGRFPLRSNVYFKRGILIDTIGFKF